MSFSPLKLGLGLPYSGFVGGLDPDAKAYIAAVEAADAQTLESGVKKAINNFVVGCKADGIWDAIKASCILAGARTLSGALVPLKGTAPTNFNFVSGDYNRETGLKGDGSTKYLDSNRNNNADPQNDFHAATYRSTAPSELKFLIGAGASPSTGRLSIASDSVTGRVSFRLRSNASAAFLGAGESGLVAGSRSVASDVEYVVGSASGSFFQVSETPLNATIGIFANGVGALPSSARLAFYSIGESLDLADLDARVSTLVAQITLGIRGSDFDTDAAAYITSLRTAGSDVTTTQVSALNTFYKAGKSQGWYSSLKRMYLPIWGAASPNAIDLIELGSGTFVGGVTHGAGFVQGDGSTGYFTTVQTLHTILSDTAEASIFRLQLAETGGVNFGGAFVSGRRLLMSHGSTGTSSTASIGRNVPIASVSGGAGIIVASRSSNTSLIMHRRVTGGFSSGTEFTTLNDLNIPNIVAFFAGGANNNGSLLASPSPGQEGAYGFGNPLDLTAAQNFSLALKNLWETCTGLTLP